MVWFTSPLGHVALFGYGNTIPNNTHFIFMRTKYHIIVHDHGSLNPPPGPASDQVTDMQQFGEEGGGGGRGGGRSSY